MRLNCSKIILVVFNICKTNEMHKDITACKDITSIYINFIYILNPKYNHINFLKSLKITLR